MNAKDALSRIEQLNESFVQAYLSQVVAPSQKKAWCYLVEPSFVGFGSVSSSEIAWPVGVEPVWERVEELRLFGDLGELHVWKRWNGRWSGRLWQQARKQHSDTFSQRYLLWGTQWDAKRCEAYEERGASVRFPPGLVLPSTPFLSLCVEVRHCVGYDSESHLAGVVDSVWCSILQKDQPLSPP